MKTLGADGREWKVFRRWLAWRPRPSRPLRFLFGVAQGGLGDPITGLLAMVAVVLAVPFLLVYLLDWLAALLLTPAALLARSTLGRPWPVVARAGKEPEFRGTADGASAAGTLVDTVREEIHRYGEPKSLTAPAIPASSPLAADDSAVPGWFRRLINQILRLSGQSPPPPVGDRNGG
jgi:hypothetical protein